MYTTGIDLKQFRRYILKRYGGRCKTYLWGCQDCMVWRLYDDARDLNDFEIDITHLGKKLKKQK